ncbi:Ku protein [Streptomyces sp. NPDC051578]|uniref:Ku protein n=1 Tax=Streptomyces sp. NPDC051578 TaxID=3365662 RepID=UPI003798F153
MSGEFIRRALGEVLAFIGLTDPTGRPLDFAHHDFRRLFITDAIPSGLPPHIAQAIVGHTNINTTMGYNAVYPAKTIEAHRAFITRRRTLRPSEEYRAPTDAEWEDFLGHFERRKLSIGTCARAYGTACIHEHACVRCSLLRPDPAQPSRLVEIRDNLLDRIAEAEREGWHGESKGSASVWPAPIPRSTRLTPQALRGRFCRACRRRGQPVTTDQPGTGKTPSSTTPQAVAVILDGQTCGERGDLLRARLAADRALHRDRQPHHPLPPAPARHRRPDPQGHRVTGFVDLDAVDPIFFDKTHYLGPRGEQYGKIYGLLERALTESNNAGIATFVMRGREYLVAVKAEDDLLTLHTLHWADEIRDPHTEVPDLPGTTRATAAEVKMATQLVDALAHTGGRRRKKQAADAAAADGRLGPGRLYGVKKRRSVACGMCPAG